MSIAAAFGRAADYDRHAALQAEVATRLAARIAGYGLPPGRRVLEIGCGTGLLGAALLPRLAGARWLMTDLAPAMVARTAARFAGQAEVATATMDGEAPDVAGPFDLIVSSLAVQWFGNLAGALPAWRARLAPGGRIAFATLAAGSLAEWHRAHQPGGAGTPDYLTREALMRHGLTVTIEAVRVEHHDARGFLRGLKGIGAATPRPGHRPATPAVLRRAMARFDAAGAVATYQIAFCEEP